MGACRIVAVHPYFGADWECCSDALRRVAWGFAEGTPTARSLSPQIPGGGDPELTTGNFFKDPVELWFNYMNIYVHIKINIQHPEIFDV